MRAWNHTSNRIAEHFGDSLVRHTWTIALCLSMTAHAALIDWRARRYVDDHTPIRLAGYSTVDPTAIAEKARLEPDEVGLGQADGAGRATDASPGDTQLQARLGEQDQSFLSRDPEGPGKVGDPPSQSLVPPGENGAGGSGATAATFGVQPQQATPQQPAPPQPKFASKPLVEPATADAQPADTNLVDTHDGPGPSNAVANSHTMMAMSAPPPMPVQPSQQAQSASAMPAGKPGPSTPAADPAPQGDSESDPFATNGSAEFRRGATKVKFGRAHKLTRPRLSWDTLYDFIGMSGAAVTLDLQIDETGHVINADIWKSSGSNSIDQPCRLAAYEWWFEPTKDLTGKLVKDDIKFTVKFF